MLAILEDGVDGDEGVTRSEKLELRFCRSPPPPPLLFLSDESTSDADARDCHVMDVMFSREGGFDGWRLKLVALEDVCFMGLYIARSNEDGRRHGNLPK